MKFNRLTTTLKVGGLATVLALTGCEKRNTDEMGLTGLNNEHWTMDEGVLNRIKSKQFLNSPGIAPKGAVSAVCSKLDSNNDYHITQEELKTNVGPATWAMQDYLREQRN